MDDLSSSSDSERIFGDIFNDSFTEDASVSISSPLSIVVDRLALQYEGVSQWKGSLLTDKYGSGFSIQHSFASGNASCNSMCDPFIDLNFPHAVDLPPFVVTFASKHHSLWGHQLWNAAKYMIKQLDNGTINVVGKAVLELGAGTGLPSIAAARHGARVVVATDYPDVELLQPLQTNVTVNTSSPDKEFAKKPNIHVRPLLWGNSSEMKVVKELTAIPFPSLHSNSQDKVKVSDAIGNGFECIFLCDLLFNSHCHEALLETVSLLLNERDPQSAAFITYSHHRPHKKEADDNFFILCARYGLSYMKIDEVMYQPMFTGDVGPAEVRGLVHVYRLWHTRDSAGPPIPIDHIYDVIIQGSGLAQTALAAGYAVASVKNKDNRHKRDSVLLLEEKKTYGGPMATWTFSEWRALFHIAHDKMGSENSMIENWCFSERFPCSTESQDAHSEAHVYQSDIIPLKPYHDILMDLYPLPVLIEGYLARCLRQTSMANMIEFKYLDKFCFLKPLSCDGQNGGNMLYGVEELIMTRESLFADYTIPPLELRRIMMALQDVAVLMADGEHARVDARCLGDHAERSSVTSISQQMHTEMKKHTDTILQRTPPLSDETLSHFLSRVYNLSPSSVEKMTLAGQLPYPCVDHLPYSMMTSSSTSFPSASNYIFRCQVDALRAFLFSSHGSDRCRVKEAVSASSEAPQRIATSSGVSKCPTPFLIPIYGTNTLCEGFGHLNAIWGGTTVLGRHIVSLHPAEQNPKDGSESLWCAELSNGQWIHSKTVVLAETSETTGMRSVAARVMVITRSPLFVSSRKRSLSTESCVHGENIWALWRMESDDSTLADEKQVVWIQQWGLDMEINMASSDSIASTNAATGSCLIHLTLHGKVHEDTAMNDRKRLKDQIWKAWESLRLLACASSSNTLNNSSDKPHITGVKERGVQMRSLSNSDILYECGFVLDPILFNSITSTPLLTDPIPPRGLWKLPLILFEAGIDDGYYMTLTQNIFKGVWKDVEKWDSQITWDNVPFPDEASNDISQDNSSIPLKSSNEHTTMPLFFNIPFD